jgi:hypothetical protein
MNFGAWTCKWMRGLPEEDGRRGPQKEDRSTGPGRPVWGPCCPNCLGSSPTCSLLHYVLVSSCSTRIHRPNSLGHSFVFEWWDQRLPPLLCVTSCLPWFVCFHLFPTKQCHVALLMLVLYMCPRYFEDKVFPWCIIEHKVLNKPQNLPLIMFRC